MDLLFFAFLVTACIMFSAGFFMLIGLVFSSGNYQDEDRYEENSHE